MVFDFRFTSFFSVFISLALFWRCTNPKPVEVKQLSHPFEILAPETTHVEFNNQLTSTADLNILNYLYFYNGSGVAAGDLNNDGLDDLYFASNQSGNQLYLNRGNFEFLEVTSRAGLENFDWSTGVSLVDIDANGWLDIYVCEVDLSKEGKTKNKLYLNQGLNDSGIPVFVEKAAAFGLDFSGYSTHAAFFDYDLDGDLDVFLLNHSVHPNRNYGKGSQRTKLDERSGDRLFRNDKGIFKDVSREAGIFSSKIGYGLGLGVSDINSDGYPDIYVGNDFFENDYLYLNQGDGTFTEIIHSNPHFLGHTTHFSMGNDLADLNNDGRVDLLSMDMLPEDLFTYKSSGTEYGFDIYRNYLKNGYAPQYMQNTLHLNRGNGYFSEMANLAGVAASEWSWAGLLFDFDNDGNKDIFISNGIVGATNDMDYISFISSENIQRRLSQQMTAEDMEMIDEIPQKKVSNYFFQNNGDLSFTKLPLDKPSYSNGTVYTDLDNDGDLDLVTNNINEKAFVYRNHSEKLNHRFLKIEFKGSEKNPGGIGAKVKVFAKDQVFFLENFLSRGYLSSVSPILSIGLGEMQIIDSLTVIWPDRQFQKYYNINSDQTLVVDHQNSGGYYDPAKSKSLQSENTSLPLFTHKDPDSYEFVREPLVPYMSSHLGPKISVGDVNNDQLEDVFIGNGKKEIPGLLIQQSDGSFKNQNEAFEQIRSSENTEQLFLDVDRDGYPDLFIANGGHEFTSGEPIQPNLFINTRGEFRLERNRLPKIELNAATAAAHDFDNDGDLDIFIGAGSVAQQFGATPTSFLLINDGKGYFTEASKEIISGLDDLGMIRDAIWNDLDLDGYSELILVGHWMPITIFKNDRGHLKRISAEALENTNGLWNTIAPFDLDSDGDTDLILGNWGLNTRLKASREKPLTLYLNDFDGNGKQDPILTYFWGEQETVFATKDEITKQIPSLNKKFLSYQSFAKAGFEDLFDQKQIKKATVKKVYQLASIVLENKGNFKFETIILPKLAQISSVHAIDVDDYDQDGNLDVFLGGNDYQVNTQLGQLDASQGQVFSLHGKNNLKINHVLTQKFTLPGAIRDIRSINISGEKYKMIARNNDSVELIKLK